MSTKPRYKKFKYLSVEAWVHPTFGPQVDIGELEVEWKNRIFLDASFAQVAKELRRIAAWLEKP